MEILIILILILLAAIIPIKIFRPVFILLAALGVLMDQVTLPYITAVTGTTFTYATLDPIFQYALGLILLATALILFLDLLGDDKKDENN